MVSSTLQGGLKFSQLGSVGVDLIRQLGTPLGKFWQTFPEHAAAQREAAACNEVLPISLEAIEAQNSTNGVDFCSGSCASSNTSSGVQRRGPEVERTSSWRQTPGTWIRGIN